jgi:hypothetical protein
VRYRIDPPKIEAFERFAKAWIRLNEAANTTAISSERAR